MKKTLLTTIAILTCVIIFSFTVNTENDEIIITVSADKPTKFDMSQNSKTSKGLTTPYEIKLKSDDSRFIFKSNNSKTNLKIQAKKKGAELSATWPIAVLLIDGDKMTTFGID
jgi:uncharacterized protein YxeA